ncbi:hypothetical protein JQX13_17815 [Archangium violaceum]|uniref:hypothetical protein n=1 Tax=Archangium violaceum TaxID=83451 RepID=UPI00193C14CA|nr:hypothetical protein [Archangium violaceum]QRK11756.1 hypothetical protein JQX13_17815 [Archangium violaceum]
MTTYLSSVRATEQIIDEDRMFAEPGDVGTVLDRQRYADGSWALTVTFPNAPCATTCFLWEDVEFVPTAKA